MLPLLLLPVGLVVVPVTEIVTPAQGSLGAGSPLEQLPIKRVVDRNKIRYAAVCCVVLQRLNGSFIGVKLVYFF